MYYLVLIILIIMYCIFTSDYYRQFQKAVKGPYFEGNRLDDIIEDQKNLDD